MISILSMVDWTAGEAPLGSIGRVFAQPASADCAARAEGAAAFHVPAERICRSRLNIICVSFGHGL